MSGKRRFFRTRHARQDLIEIWQHIAADNPTTADALLDALRRRAAASGTSMEEEARRALAAAVGAGT